MRWGEMAKKEYQRADLQNAKKVTYNRIERCVCVCVRLYGEPTRITIKINKRDNLLINDHQKASSTLTSPSKALALTMLQPPVCISQLTYTQANEQVRTSCSSFHLNNLSPKQLQQLYLNRFIYSPKAYVQTPCRLRSRRQTHTVKAKSLSFISHFSFIFSLGFALLLHHFILFQTRDSFFRIIFFLLLPIFFSFAFSFLLTH